MAIFYILTTAINGITGLGTLIMLVIGGPFKLRSSKAVLTAV